MNWPLIFVILSCASDVKYLRRFARSALGRCGYDEGIITHSNIRSQEIMSVTADHVNMIVIGRSNRIVASLDVKGIFSNGLLDVGDRKPLDKVNSLLWLDLINFQSAGQGERIVIKSYAIQLRSRREFALAATRLVSWTSTILTSAVGGVTLMLLTLMMVSAMVTMVSFQMSNIFLIMTMVLPTLVVLVVTTGIVTFVVVVQIVRFSSRFAIVMGIVRIGRIARMVIVLMLIVMTLLFTCAPAMLFALTLMIVLVVVTFLFTFAAAVFLTFRMMLTIVFFLTSLFL